LFVSLGYRNTFTPEDTYLLVEPGAKGETVAKEPDDSLPMADNEIGAKALPFFASAIARTVRVAEDLIILI
jgi:hypothetical protein